MYQRHVDGRRTRTVAPLEVELARPGTAGRRAGRSPPGGTRRRRARRRSCRSRSGASSPRRLARSRRSRRPRADCTSRWGLRRAAYDSPLAVAREQPRRASSSARRRGARVPGCVELRLARARAAARPRRRPGGRAPPPRSGVDHQRARRARARTRSGGSTQVLVERVGQRDQAMSDSRPRRPTRPERCQVAIMLPG